MSFLVLKVESCIRPDGQYERKAGVGHHSQRHHHSNVIGKERMIIFLARFHYVWNAFGSFAMVIDQSIP